MALPLLLLLSLVKLSIPPARCADPVEARIGEIRARYNAIESAKLRSQTVEFEAEDGTVSSTCTIYFQGGEIVKVHLFRGSDHWASDEYFYYSGGELIFAFATDGSWRFTGKTLANGESETVDRTVEHRVYFSAGRVIRHLLREASSTDPGKLKGLLAKASNRASDDTDRAEQLARRGKAARSVKSAADLRDVFDELN